MNWFQFAQAPLAKAFGWALLHSLWQSLIIYICLRLMLHFTKRASAAFRYHIALFSLIAIIAWFALTFIHELQLMPANGSDAAAIPLDLSVISAQPINQATSTTPAPDVLANQLQTIFPYLLILYSLGFFFSALRLGNDFYLLRKLRKSSYEVPDKAWQRYFKNLESKLDITIPATFRLSDKIPTPLMIGYIKPIVFLPACMMNNLTPEQIEALLLHELAHIKRNDFLVNLIQSFIELILFYNPLVHLISRRIRDERELSCDEMVVKAKTSPAVYASALVALEELRQPFNYFSMAASGHKNKLIHRVKHIMEMKHTRLSITQRLIVFGLIAGSLSSIAWLNPSSIKPVEKAKDKVVNETIKSVNKLLPALTPHSLNQAVADTNIIQKDSEEININIDTTFNINDNVKVNNDSLDINTNDSLLINFKYNPKFDFQFDSAQWEQVGKAQKEAMRQLKKIDWEQMKLQQEKAWEQMKKMNWDSLSDLQRQAMLQLKKVDWDKVQKQQAMAMMQMQKMDTLRIKEQLKQARIMAQKFNSDSMQRVMQKAMQKLNSDSMQLIINKAMAEANKINSDSMRLIMAKARAEMIKAHHFMYSQSADELVASMREDGLIKGDNYHIKLTDKALYINGKQQPASIYKKYKVMTGGETQLYINNANGKRSISIQQNDNK